MSNQSQPAVEKKYYRATEIAKICGIGRSSLYKWIKKGYLAEPFKLGTASLWKKEDVERFFERLEKGDFKEWAREKP